jgi:HEAT repeat protein
MLRRTIAALTLVLIAAATLAGSKPEAPPVPAVLQPSAEELKRVTEDVTKALADKNDELIAKAIGDMESLRHETFVPFIRTTLKSGDPPVRAAALRAAATHELRDIEKDVRKFLKSKPDKKDGVGLNGRVGAAAIDYLVRLDMGGEGETVLEDYLTVLFADERRMGASFGPDLLRACIHYLGKTKYKRSVPKLIDLVDQPAPKDPNDPKNPGESYWKARVKLWQQSEGWVRWALKEITGQEMRSAREWEAWLKENKKDYK